MKDYKKTLFGSIITFFIGTSCCWLSSLAMWIGGATLIGTLITFIEDMQLILLVLGGGLAVFSFYLYSRKKKFPQEKKRKF